MKFDSEGTRKEYKKVITWFQRFMKEKESIDIETLKDEYREAKYKGELEKEKFLDRLRDAMEDYFCYLKTRELSPGHEHTVLATVASFIRKGCSITDVSIELPKRVYVKYHNRDITKEEIRQIMDHATFRDKTFFLLLAESGLRPSTLLQVTYELIKTDFEAGKVPMKIELPSRILKDRVSARWAFIGEDGFKFLKEYLSQRKGIKDDDLIFSSERLGKRRGEPLLEQAMSNKFNNIVKKLGLAPPREGNKPKSLRLYCLRKFWFNNLKADSDYKNFWFCHKTVNDYYISQDIEKHREKYLEGYKFLRVFEPASQELQIEALTNELKKERAKRTETESKIDALEQRFQDIQKQLKELLDQK